MKKILAFLTPVVIFLANLGLVWPLFAGGYTSQIGSIESVFIADARFIFENFPHLSWNPFWYTGFPFHLFYTPLLPFLMAGLHFLFKTISLASWYRILIGFFYAATPVSFYFLVNFLTGKKLVGFFAALLYSFLPFSSYIIPQINGMASIYGNAPWRLLTLILFGEGGHIVGLFFLPLSLLFFIKAIRKNSRRNIFWACFWTALLALANLIALIGFAVMLAVVLVVELFAGDWLKKVSRAGVISLLSYGVVAFWFNFSFIKASLSIGTGGVSGSVADTYLRFLPFIFFLPPVFFILKALFKREFFRPLLIGSGWLLIFFAATYFWFRDQTMLLPQPNRYVPEMEMGVSLFVSWLTFLVIRKIFGQKLALLAKAFYLFLIIPLILNFPLKYGHLVWQLLEPHQAITKTSEYQIASWLNKNTHGERVYATGTSAFWLNTFVDIPQVRGGNDGVANSWLLHAVYQINTGENAPKNQEGQVAVWWLRALNVAYLVVNLPSSREIYHDFINPEKFAKVSGVKELVDLNGDVIYKIPLEKPCLAQVVKKRDFEDLKPLKNAVDVEGLQKYVDYIDPPSLEASEGQGPPSHKATEGEVDFSWIGVGRAKIKAKLEQDEGIAVQVTYNPGWKAYLENKKIKVNNDIIGFMFLDSETSGPVEIDLIYRRTWDVWLGYFITILTVLYFLNANFVSLNLFEGLNR